MFLNNQQDREEIKGKFESTFRQMQKHNLQNVQDIAVLRSKFTVINAYTGKEEISKIKKSNIIH